MKTGTLKCARLEFSGCHVKPRRPHQTGPPGLAHDSPRTPNVHISGPRHFKHHQNSTKKNKREGEKNRKLWREREKKSAKFWAPTVRGPHPSGPHPSGPPLFLGLVPHPLGPHHDTKNIGQKNWIGQNWIGQNWLWPELAGPKPRWPKRDWPKSASSAHSPCASRLTTWSRGGGGGTMSPQRTRMEVHRRNPQQPYGPTKTGQVHVHWHTQAWTTNGDAMLVVLDRRGEAQSAPSLWPTDSRRHEPPLTNGLRSQLREQPTGRGHDCPRALDKCAA